MPLGQKADDAHIVEAAANLNRALPFLEQIANSEQYSQGTRSRAEVLAVVIRGKQTAAWRPCPLPELNLSAILTAGTAPNRRGNPSDEAARPGERETSYPDGKDPTVPSGPGRGRIEPRNQASASVVNSGVSPAAPRLRSYWPCSRARGFESSSGLNATPNKKATGSNDWTCPASGLNVWCPVAPRRGGEKNLSRSR